MSTQCRRGWCTISVWWKYLTPEIPHRKFNNEDVDGALGCGWWCDRTYVDGASLERGQRVESERGE